VPRSQFVRSSVLGVPLTVISSRWRIGYLGPKRTAGIAAVEHGGGGKNGRAVDSLFGEEIAR